MKRKKFLFLYYKSKIFAWFSPLIQLRIILLPLFLMVTALVIMFFFPGYELASFISAFLGAVIIMILLDQKKRREYKPKRKIELRLKSKPEKPGSLDDYLEDDKDNKDNNDRDIDST